MSNTAPHLPEETQRQKGRGFFLVVVLFGLFAGFFGGFLSIRLIVPDLFSDVVSTLPLSPHVRLDRVEQKTTQFENMVAVSHSLVNVAGDRIGSAVAYTTDGWMVTDKKTAEHATHIRISGELFALDTKQTAVDDVSGIGFVRAKNGTFTTTRLSDGAGWEVGDTLYVVSDTSGIMSVRVSVPYASLQSGHDVFEAHEFSRVIGVDRLFDKRMDGSPVFDAGGGLVGLLRVNEDALFNVVIPVRHFSQVFKDVVQNGVVSHAYLGVRYVPSGVLGVNLSEFSPGVKVVGSARYGIAAVRFSSPAFMAGIREGDVIMAVDGVQVGVRETLPLVLSRYEPGQTITISYMRAGELIDVNVVLSKAD